MNPILTLIAKTLSTLTLFLCYYLPSAAQPLQPSWPPLDWRETTIYTVHTKGGWSRTRNFYGNVILKNGDTLRGCSIRPWHHDCDILPHNCEKLQTIANVSIQCIQTDTPAPDNQNIELRPVSKHCMWRLLKREGKVSIYDMSSDLDFNKWGIKIIMIKDNKITRLGGSLAFGYTRNKYGLMLRYINKKYQQSFKMKDFRTHWDMIEYIVQQENKG